MVVTSCRALPLTHVTDVDAISPQGAVRYGDCKHWFVYHDTTSAFGAVRSGLGFASAAGGKYGGRKVRSGNIFGYHLWPRASTRLKPRSITSVCLPESRYEGLSTAPSHGHVRNDLPSKFTSAVNSSPAALSPRSLPTSKSNQKRVNVHCYGNEHC